MYWSFMSIVRVKLQKGFRNVAYIRGFKNHLWSLICWRPNLQLNRPTLGCVEPNQSTLCALRFCAEQMTLNILTYKWTKILFEKRQIQILHIGCLVDDWYDFHKMNIRWQKLPKCVGQTLIKKRVLKISTFSKRRVRNIYILPYTFTSTASHSNVPCKLSLSGEFYKGCIREPWIQILSLASQSVRAVKYFVYKMIILLLVGDWEIKCTSQLSWGW